VRLAGLVPDSERRLLRAAVVDRAVIPGSLAGLTVSVALFALWHASTTLGVRRTAALFAVAASASWIFEELGVTTGLLYGPYHYTAALGPWLGSVPVLIPLGWCIVMYPSYLAANLMVDGGPVAARGTLTHLLGVAFLGALVMTAWDLLADPILSGQTVRAWVWERGGPYFGVPTQNFLGWFVTAFVISVLYRVLERRWVSTPMRSIQGSEPMVTTVRRGEDRRAWQTEDEDRPPRRPATHATRLATARSASARLGTTRGTRAHRGRVDSGNGLVLIAATDGALDFVGREPGRRLRLRAVEVGGDQLDVRPRGIYGKRSTARRVTADAHGGPEGGVGRGRE
jgi:Carotenoid biosynthesis protein